MTTQTELEKRLQEHKQCKWTYDPSSYSWNTSCKNKFQFLEDGPVENKFAYCSYCGGRIDLEEENNENI